MTDPCPGCGFDSRAWSPRDEETIFRALDLWWELATVGIDAGLLPPRPGLGAIHDVTHQMMDIAVALAPLRSVPRHGRVEQVNAGDGGVPKLPTTGRAISFDGLEGDRQADRKHHGRPFQALCLWSTEVIDELAAAGHPIAAGNAGENLTVSGLDWPAMRPGVLLRIGTALAEVSFPATPCAKQAGWFTDGDFRRIDHDNNPNWTRWYAWVRQPGRVNPGDAVSVQRSESTRLNSSHRTVSRMPSSA